MAVCCVFMSQAQTIISTADLNGTKWKLVSPKDDGCLKNISFTLRSKIDRIAFVNEGKTYRYSIDYYISPTIPTKYNKDFVGKNRSGKYIIQCVYDEVFWFEVLKFTKKELRLRSKLGQTFVFSNE